MSLFRPLSCPICRWNETVSFCPMCDQLDPVLEALARAPVDTEPLPPELEAELEQRIADVRAGTVQRVEITIPSGEEDR